MIVVIDHVPRYTLSIHSSKALLVEQKMLPATALADAVIQLAIGKGERHEVTVIKNNLLVRLHGFYSEIGGLILSMTV